MVDKQKITEEIDELRNFLDVELHPVVSPDRWDIYSTLCDMVDELETAILDLLKEQNVDTSKYQYKYDHTDCIWYHNGRGRCPSTCSQYRDGWNDAMNFIFKNGAGYRPYKRK